MTRRGAVGGWLMALAAAAPAAAGGPAVDCDAIMAPVEVQAGCGIPVTVTPGRVYAEYERQMTTRAFQIDHVAYTPTDTTECAKRFDAGDGRHLFVTVALKSNADDARALYDVNEGVLTQAPDYERLFGIGDSARRFTRDFRGMRVHELEFIKNRWRVSLRTGDGEVEGELYQAFCDFDTMERLAGLLAARLPEK